MTKTITSLSSLVFSIVLLVSGNTLLMTLLGVRMTLAEIDTQLIGWVLVCYSLGFVLGSLYCPRIVTRVGHIRSFAVFCALMSMVAILHPLHLNLFSWAFLRFMAGVSMAGLLLVVESWFSTRATNDNRGALFATYQVVFYLASAGGQLLLSFASPSGTLLFSVASLLLTFALVPLALTRLEAPSIEQVERLGLRELMGISSLGLIAATLCGVVISAFNNIGPVYGSLINLDFNQIAFFMATTVVAAMFFAWPLGRLSDLFDRRKVLLSLSTVAGLTSLVAAFWGHAQILALFVSAEISIGIAASLYPVAVALVNDRLHSNHIVPASATLLLCFGIGSCIGPILGSSMIAMLGPSGLFIGTSGCLLFLSAYTYWYIQNSKRIPVEAQESFVTTLPASTQVLMELDPRNEEFVEVGTEPEPETEDAPEHSTTNQPTHTDPAPTSEFDATDTQESAGREGHERT